MTAPTPADAPDLSKKLLTIDEVAEMTRISTGTLYRWRSEGEGQGPRSFTVGRRVVYRLSVVQAWIDSQEALAS